MFGRLRKKSLICNGNQRCSCMSTKTMTKPDNEASPAMYADRNKKWMPIIIEAVKEMPTLLCLEPVTSQARMVSSRNFEPEDQRNTN